MANDVEFLCHAEDTLLDVLRDRLGLTGSKEGCGTGDCGACSVIVDDQLVCSCLVLGAEAEGRRIETIEGMANGEELHPLQSKFLDHAALQCGVCTPGFLIAARDLLQKNPDPTEEEIRFGLAGNLCPLHRLRQDRARRSGRCTGGEGKLTMNFDPRYADRKFNAVGTRPVRPDGVDKVTGRARYGADLNMPGQLVGRVLRSPYAHAEIKKIDTSKAERLKGVKAVITVADLPDLTDGNTEMYDILDNCMARGTALYDGHAIAAVAAIDARTAREALKLIKVDYKVLPHVTDVDEAVKPSAPLVRNDVFTAGVNPKPAKPSNITKRSEYGHGDVQAGFAAADAIVEHSFKTEQTHQGYIEPHACVASVNSDGSAELWVCTQGHFVFRQHCAELLGIDVSRLRVTSSEIGGGFGGKTHVWIRAQWRWRWRERPAGRSSWS